MGRLDILAVICDLSKLGEHLSFRDANVVKASKTVICCSITSQRFGTNISDCDPRKDLVIVSVDSQLSTQEKEPERSIPIDLSWIKNKCGP